MTQNRGQQQMFCFLFDSLILGLCSLVFCSGGGRFVVVNPSFSALAVSLGYSVIISLFVGFVCPRSLVTRFHAVEVLFGAGFLRLSLPCVSHLTSIHLFVLS